LLALELDLVALEGEQGLEREHEGRFAELGQGSTPVRRRTSRCGRQPGWSEEPARAAAVIAVTPSIYVRLGRKISSETRSLRTLSPRGSRELPCLHGSPGSMTTLSMGFDLWHGSVHAA
jgi:hypothetical protein